MPAQTGTPFEERGMPGGKSITRERLVRHLDDYLKISAVSDSSLNGLQVEGNARVHRVAFSVDACLETIRAAARWKADMLVVHHGLFWNRKERLTGVMGKRVTALIRGGVSLYAAHLPLDCHEEVGNNVELARLLGLERGAAFGDYHGVLIGFITEADKGIPRKELVGRLQTSLKSTPELLGFGPKRVRKIAIISGGAAEFVTDARDAGCDTFITGESSHIAYHLAKEARINLIYAGHYASETVGVKALARYVKERFSLNCRFISAPTGY
jgi:dinuclear metal center YbgI/SA1388 family protein